MQTIIEQTLGDLATGGNLRLIPDDATKSGRIDFSSNDYLGIATRADLRQEFFSAHDPRDLLMSASASRLLARTQTAFGDFEKSLHDGYGRPALIFNSGYHANTGLVSALATKDYTILADKLVHASIIDGIKLSGAPFERFRHNDMQHLALLADKISRQGRKLLIIVESVYSMDGDQAPIREIAAIKRKHEGALLYVDEAHAVGVEGPGGLGLVMAMGDHQADVDVIVGTLGKALGSTGAFAIMDDTLRSWAINRARSFIFSTALPPVTVEWSKFVFENSLGMDSERSHLKALGNALGRKLCNGSNSHIQPYMLGNPHAAVEMSQALAADGFDVLPIRTPTVPPGTDRLRLSLSAALSIDDVEALGRAIKTYADEQL